MQPDGCLGVVEGVPATNNAAPVSTLDAVLLVAEPRHERGVHLCDLLRTEPSRPRLVGKPVAWHRRCHDVERILRSAPVSHRVRQRSDDLGELSNRTRPAVRNDHRNGVGFGRALVNEVNVKVIDTRLELVKLIQLLLLRPPIEFLAPIGNKVGKVIELGAIVPPDAVKLVRKTGLL